MQVNGQFTANGSSAVANIGRIFPPTRNDFNVSLSGLTGTGATITLKRSFDGGQTWKTVTSYTQDIEDTGTEPGANIQYRLDCTGYTTGTIIYGLG